MPVPTKAIFSDIPISFTAHPITGNVKKSINRDAVKNSVRNIILTNHGERFFKPKFGGNVTSQLFENASKFTEFNTARSIRIALQNYEPRAEVINVRVDSNPDTNNLTVTLKFRILNDPEPITLDVLLERIR
jgi:phage baseplate assembly protein W